MKKIMYFLSLSLIALVVISSSCNRQEKAVPDSMEPRISVEDSVRIAKTAVDIYVKSEQRKRYVADSALIALGFKELDFSGLGTFSYEKIRPQEKITFVYSRDIGWLTTYTFGLTYNEERLLFSEIRTNSNVVLNALDKNKSAIKKVLELTGYHDGMRNFYGRTKVWLEGENPTKAKQFSDFFTKHGHLKNFPDRTDTISAGIVFWNDMDKITKSDPAYFGETRFYTPPESYKEWLFVQRWKIRLGDETAQKYAESIRTILYD